MYKKSENNVNSFDLYRKCVVIVVFDNLNNKCLVGKRMGTNHGWQFPQGGVDEGESYNMAAKRELFEEMGITGCIIDNSADNQKQFNIDVCCVANIDQAIIDHDFDNLHRNHFSRNYLPSVQFAKHVGPYRYDYPNYVNRKELGQEQIWFLAYKNGPINVILNDEFSDYQWMDPIQIIDYIVLFKKEVYINALKDLGLI